MLNRMTLMASSILALVVAVNALATQPGRAEVATKGTANECLGKPNGAPPRGSHWFYRVDRPSGRRCWYLGSENTKVRRAAATEQAASPPAPPPDELLPAERTRAESPAAVTNNANTADRNSVTAAHFSATWPAASNPAGSNDHDSAAASGSDDAAEPTTAETQGEMPLVWPVLSPDTAAAGPSSEPAPGIGHLLLFLAAIVTFVAVAVRIVLKLSSALFKRSAPRPIVQQAAPVIRQRSLQRLASDHITGTAARGDRALRPLDVATRWDTVDRLPRTPSVPLYDDTPVTEEARAPWRRRVA